MLEEITCSKYMYVFLTDLKQFNICAIILVLLVHVNPNVRVHVRGSHKARLISENVYVADKL
jgi:hypothetical protein